MKRLKSFGVFITQLVSKTPSPEFQPIEPALAITEGVSGYWHYHISHNTRYSRALCSAKTMYTAIPIEQWGIRFGQHLPKRPTWCEHCERMAGL